VRENGLVSLVLVPDQALYQAEPQPENDRMCPTDAALTSRILWQIARSSKSAALPKAAPLRARIDAFVSEGRLTPFGYYR
jgi:hypothetical protein